jgi:DNA-binding transcriptional ArsR family regulator
MVSNIVNVVSKNVNDHAPAILGALNSYWYILVQLSRGKRYVAELAQLTRRKPPQISKDLKALRNQGLVESLSEEGGRKYFSLTVRGRNIFEGVAQTINAPQDIGVGPVGLDWKVTALLDTLEDTALSEELRLSCSQSLFSLIQKHPAEMLHQERVRELAKTIVKGITRNPSVDRVTDDLRRSAKEVVSYAAGNSEWETWVLQEFYPNLVALIMNVDAGDAFREWAARLVGEVARRGLMPATRNKAEVELLTAWFRDDFDPKETLGAALVDEIMSTASREVFDQIREKAKETNTQTRSKATILLKEFTNRLNML